VSGRHIHKLEEREIIEWRWAAKPDFLEFNSVGVAGKKYVSWRSEEESEGR